jgi:hypothetical protein
MIFFFCFIDNGTWTFSFSVVRLRIYFCEQVAEESMQIFKRCNLEIIARRGLS